MDNDYIIKNNNNKCKYENINDNIKNINNKLKIKKHKEKVINNIKVKDNE